VTVSIAAQATRTRLAALGATPEAIWSEMEAARAGDVAYADGRVAGLVYLGGDEIHDVALEAYTRFFSGNAMSLKAFPSLARFEREIIEMTGGLLHGGDVVGNLTSGGSESILMGVKTARDRARALWPHITAPEMVLPFSAHPAFNKAAHYFGLKAVRTSLGPDHRVDLAAYAAAIGENTVLLVGSAPNYPFGMVDPIPQMAAERDLSFHVDACVGGFFLPFAEKLGRRVPAWDFRNRGVTSISADLHKFGYAAKGASTILYRDADVAAYSGFQFEEWPSGVYRTPTMTGTRPGGAFAAAWAVLKYLGEEGYLDLARRSYAFVEPLIAGITSIDGLRVHGQPDMTVLAYGSEQFDIYAVADGLEARGWFCYRERFPRGIHLMLSAGHEAIVDRYLADLAAAVAGVRAGAIQRSDTEARYG
jgi:sphinganine-1-phosphate aldolase